MPRYICSIEQYYREKSPRPLVDLFDSGPSQWRATCPFCTHPGQKFFVNRQTGQWQCKHCPAGSPGGKGGGLLTYHCIFKPCSIEEAKKELLLVEVTPGDYTQYNTEAFIASSIVEGYQKTLQLNIPAQQFIKTNWKFSQEAIDFFKLGLNKDALTIPIFDRMGRCSNIRQKKLHTPPDYDGPKIWSYTDDKGLMYGARRLFPVKNIDNEEVFLVAGEKDLISSWSMGLRNILTSTGGESNWWDNEWSFDFHGKTVYIVYDIDSVGLESAKEIYRRLEKIANVYIITLPEMPDFEDGRKRKDLTDFWNLGNTLDDFIKFIPSTNYVVTTNGHHPVIYNVPLPTIFSETDTDDLERIGSKSVIDDYIEYSQSRINSPASYHRLTGLWVLSNIIGKRGYSQINEDRVYPNLWCMLIGPSSTMKKSATTKLGERLLQKVIPNAVAMTSFTPIGALQALSEREDEITSAIYYDEIGMLFEQIRTADYMAEARDLLIKMMNGESLHYRRSKDSVKVGSSYTTLIGSGVGKRLAELLMWKDVDSGFIIRFLMALETDSEPYREQGYETSEQEFNRRKLLYRLEKMKERWDTDWAIPLDDVTSIFPDPKIPNSRAYHFRMNGEALDRYREFCRIVESSPEILKHEHVKLVHSRLPMFLQKIMIIYAASDRKSRIFYNCVEVNLKHVLLAIRDLDFFRRHMIDLVLHIGTSPLEHFITEGYSFIYENRRVTRQHLAAYIKTEKRTLDSVIDTMKDRGMIVSRKIGGMEEFMPSVN